jgi:tetratricopeptide (TPR) repeat protein
MTREDAARASLREAMAAHEKGDIDAAIASAERALRLDPQFADAYQYLGSTLVTRRRDFGRGLQHLERARELAPDDPVVHYTLGWSYEFVAHEVSRRPHRGSPPQASAPLDPDELYAKAADALRRCIALGPDEGMLDDAQKLLETITG